MSDQPPSGWRLVRQTPADQAKGLPAGFDVLRLVDATERDTIRDSQALFNSFAVQWPWNRLVEASQDFQQALMETMAAIGKAAGAINPADAERVDRAFGAVLRLLVAWLAQLPAETDQTFGRDSGEAARIRAAIAKITSAGTGTAMCLASAGFVERGWIRLELVSTQQGATLMAFVDERVSAAIGATATPGQRVLADQLVLRMIREVEWVAATQLIVNKERLLKAGERLMGLLAEIVYGAPALLPDSQAESLGGTTSPELSLEPIILSPIGPVMMAVRVAEQRLKQQPPALPPTMTALSDAEDRDVDRAQPEVDEGTGPDSSPEVGSGPTAELLSDSTSESTKREDTSETSGAQIAHDTGSASDSAGAAPRGAVADLTGLLTHISKLSRRVERAWSAAVDPDRDMVSRELLGQWYSFLQVLRDQSMLLNQELEARGHSTRLPGIPLDAETAATLFPSPDEQQHIIQLLIAEIYALEDLVNAIRGLEKPTAVTVNLATGTGWTWWEAGAFSRVRELARVMARVLAALHVVTRDSTPRDGDAGTTSGRSNQGISVSDSGYRRRPGSWREQAALAAEAINHGLPEASILYSATAVQWMVRDVQDVKGSNRTQVSVAQAFERTPRLNPLAGAVARLAETAKLLVDGQPVTIGITLSLAHFWVDRFSEWVRDDPTDDIANSLIGESEISLQSDEEPTESGAQAPPTEKEGGSSGSEVAGL